MTTGADLKVHIRPRQIEIIKEQAAHPFVIMLASMDEELVERFRMFGERGDNGCHLDQIGSRADDVDDLHRQCSSAGSSPLFGVTSATVVSMTESMRSARVVRS